MPMSLWISSSFADAFSVLELLALSLRLQERLHRLLSSPLVAQRVGLIAVVMSLSQWMVMLIRRGDVRWISVASQGWLDLATREVWTWRTQTCHHVILRGKCVFVRHKWVENKDRIVVLLSESNENWEMSSFTDQWILGIKSLEVNSYNITWAKALYDIDDVGLILGFDLSTVKNQCSFALRGLDEKPWERYLKLWINTATGDFSKASRTVQHHTAFSQTWLWLKLQHFSKQTSDFSGISSGYLVAASLKAEIAETWRLEAQNKAGKWPHWWITQDGKLDFRSACYNPKL